MPIDDGFPWSEFPDHYLTPGEVEEAFGEANADDEADLLVWAEARNAIAGEPANVPF